MEHALLATGAFFATAAYGANAHIDPITTVVGALVTAMVSYVLTRYTNILDI
jgi:hypothetical protein